MRLLAHLLTAMAVFVFGCAILLYGFFTNLACGHAPSASGCRALPWELGDDDRFWLVQLPLGIVAVLLASAWLARRAAHRNGASQGGR